TPPRPPAHPFMFWARYGVVKVPADLRAGRDVFGGEAHAVDVRQSGRQQRGLERTGDRSPFVVDGCVVDGQRRTAGDVLEDGDLVRVVPLLGVPADGERADALPTGHQRDGEA